MRKFKQYQYFPNFEKIILHWIYQETLPELQYFYMKKSVKNSTQSGNCTLIFPWVVDILWLPPENLE